MKLDRPQEALVFVSMVGPGETAERQAVLLAESIRAFGGALAQAPLWWFAPSYLASDGTCSGATVTPEAQTRLTALDVDLIPFEIDAEVARFFFASDLTAAALAEERAEEVVEQVAWLSANTLVLQQPSGLLLGPGKQLGYRPVHHTNVGSRWEAAPDSFWSEVYRCCRVPDERVFPMLTHVDGVEVRPYFNAGHLVVRPERGLLRAWRDVFFQAYQSDELQSLYRKDRRYLIFVHQAILSGVVLASLNRDEMQEMPGSYNYPLHLYVNDNTSGRPASLESIVTCRYEEWEDLVSLPMPAGEGYRAWLGERLG